MLKKIFVYHMAMLRSTMSFSGASKNWRRFVPDYVSLAPLLIIPLLFRDISIPLIYWALFVYAPLAFFLDPRIGKNTFCEYLPVNRNVRVVSMFLFIPLMGFVFSATFVVISIVGLFPMYVLDFVRGAPIVFSEIFFIQVQQEFFFLLSTGCIASSLLMITFYLRNLITKLVVRLLFYIAYIAGWYFLQSLGSPGDFIGLRIGWPGTLGLTATAIVIFAVGMAVSMGLEHRGRGKFLTVRDSACNIRTAENGGGAGAPDDQCALADADL